MSWLSDTPTSPYSSPNSRAPTRREKRSRKDRREYAHPIFDFEDDTAPPAPNTLDMLATYGLADSKHSQNNADLQKRATRYYGTQVLVPEGSVSPCLNATDRARRQRRSRVREPEGPVLETYCDITPLLEDAPKGNSEAAVKVVGDEDTISDIMMSEDDDVDELLQALEQLLLYPWDDASGQIWEVPKPPIRGRNRPTFTLNEIVNKKYDQAEALGSNSHRTQTKSTVAAKQITKPRPIFRISVPGPKDARPKFPEVPKEPHSPILEHVRRLQADEQDKRFAKVGKKSDISVNKRALMRDEKESMTLTERSKETKDDVESIPDMELELSDSDWAKPLHAITEPPPCVLQVGNIAHHTPPESKEFDALAKAVDEMWVFQNIISSPPERVAHLKSKGLRLPTKRDADSVVKNHSKVKDIDEETNDCMDLDLEEDDFERLETATKNESEHNGARRRWYKGYRR